MRADRIVKIIVEDEALIRMMAADVPTPVTRCRKRKAPTRP